MASPSASLRYVVQAVLLVLVPSAVQATLFETIDNGIQITLDNTFEYDLGMMMMLQHAMDNCQLDRSGISLDDMKGNIDRLQEYASKGWIEALAKGEKSVQDFSFPDPQRKPCLIPTYLPCIYPEEKGPVLDIQQIFDGYAVNTFEVGVEDTTPDPSARKRRSSGDENDSLMDIPKSLSRTRRQTGGEEESNPAEPTIFAGGVILDDGTTP